MLSISSRKASAGDIRAYLEGERDGANRGPEDYYADGGNAAGRWLGSGASALSLNGEVNPQAFDRLAAGFHPETNEALVQRAGEQHRPGWDMTFSAPKSVSVVWGTAELKQREAIERAHAQAVERTLSFAEQQSLFITRLGKDGVEREVVKPLIATYVHGTSREADPQLHTHAFVMNVAERADGKFGTLESKPLYEWKMALGAVYRAELAENLRTLGYSVEADAKNNFRLPEVSRDIERHFSKRREQIEQALSQRGATGAKASELAALETRKQKDAQTPTTLRAQWREQAAERGLTAQRLTDLPTERIDERRAIDTAAIIKNLNAQRSTFTRADVVRAAAEAMQTAGGGLARIEETTKQLVTAPEVVKLAEDRYTTREMLSIERGAVERAANLAKDRSYAIDANALTAAANSRPLSQEQREALDHLTSPSRLAVLEGLAGTGKSHLLGAAREAWESSGYETRGAALAGKAAQGLAEGSGIRSQTLHSLLKDLSDGRDQLSNRTVLVIDEAGMVGSRQLARVLEEVDKAQAKVILVGDANQLQPIEAGQLFERVGQQVGAAQLTEIRRQRAESERSMVKALASGDTRAALVWLQEHGRIHTANDREQATKQLVQDWSRTRDANQPGEDLMLGATRADAKALNTLAREHLQSQGELKRERLVETARGSLPLAEGDRIVITRNAKVLGMMNGDLATVKELTERRGAIEVTAQLDRGVTRTWRVSEHPHIDHGYALTVHKAQGATVDRAYVLAHESLSSREWSYVAGSRARESVHLYAEKQTAGDLERIMGRSDKKDTTLNYESTGAATARAAEVTKAPAMELER